MQSVDEKQAERGDARITTRGLVYSNGLVPYGHALAHQEPSLKSFILNGTNSEMQIIWVRLL
jgi:hypothetical protein